MCANPDTFHHHLKTLFQQASSNPLNAFLLAPQIRLLLTTACIYKLYLLTYLHTCLQADMYRAVSALGLATQTETNQHSRPGASSKLPTTENHTKSVYLAVQKWKRLAYRSVIWHSNVFNKLAFSSLEKWQHCISCLHQTSVIADTLITQ